MTTFKAGTVKWFDDRRGYGFIIPDVNLDASDIHEDVIVHYKVIDMDGHRTLKEGQRVLFKAGSKGARGIAATYCKP